MKWSYTLIAFLSCWPLAAVTAEAQPAAAPPLAKWTVLAYMNGHNNLENEIPVNFRQMSAVGSTSQVNIVAQVAKLGAGTSGQAWRDKAFRYRITKDMPFNPGNAVQTLGRTDMGDPATLKNFLQWGAEHYPAEHFALVMWGHGQGYRMQMFTAGLQHRLSILRGMNARALPSDLHAFNAAHAYTDARSAKRPDSNAAASDPAQLNLTATNTTLSVSPYRTVSNDDVFGSKLYVSDLQSVLKDEVANDPNLRGKLSLLGFDACLMAMIENAYAFRDVAQIMVASQDLDPGAGWSYRAWLAPLTQAPSMGPEKVGALIVDSFADAYQKIDGTTTMSEVDLGQADALARVTSQLAAKMITALPGALTDIRAARARCPYYAPDAFGDGHDYFYHIDLGYFVDGLTTSNDPTLKSAAAETRQALKAAVLRSYAGSERVSFGSNGLCIYFPASLDEFNGDLYAENGYLKTNVEHPVEFVHALRWSDFLDAYYSSITAAHPAPSAARAQHL